jgi:hypothetical protein
MILGKTFGGEPPLFMVIIFFWKEVKIEMPILGGVQTLLTCLPLLKQDVFFVTDTGTGNTLIDAFTRFHFPKLVYD